MKNKLLPLIFIVLFNQFPLTALSQQYYPFPEDSAVWYSVHSWPEINPPPPYWYETIKYETNGDTIINTIKYTKLYSMDPQISDPHYLGCYRVDKIVECVYFIDVEYGTESILYDFSMVPGDSLILNLDGSDEHYILKCIDTSTIIFNDNPQHLYYIYSYLTNGAECYTIWVKGIGSLRMPIETEWFCASWFEGMYNLTCFYFTDELIYQWNENPFFEGCIGNNVGIKEISSNNFISIVPNPVTHISKLITDLPENILFDYKVLDINGKIIESKQHVQLSEILIHRNRFDNGIYVLRLYSVSVNQYYSIKFIIN